MNVNKRHADVAIEPQPICLERKNAEFIDISSLKKVCPEHSLKAVIVSWKSIKIPLFDDMVSSDQLFSLCVSIGNAILKASPTVVGFEGPGGSGKSTVCHLIHKLADRNQLRNVYVNNCQDEQSVGEKLQITMQHASVCQIMDMDGKLSDFFFGDRLISWRDIATNVERRSFWRAPVFFCSNTPIHHPRVRVIKFQQCAATNAKLLELIDICLVEKKCILAALQDK